jgi:DNA repair protein RadA/Sms
MKEEQVDNETNSDQPMIELRNAIHKNKKSKTTVLESLESDSESQPIHRLTTGISELDRTLGGGLVPDAFTLVGGDPGIGKSTLLLQMAKGLVQHHPKLEMIYVSGEESIDQIRSRAKRLGVDGKGRIQLASETELEKVISLVVEKRPHVLIMDSLQTFVATPTMSPIRKRGARRGS